MSRRRFQFQRKLTGILLSLIYHKGSELSIVLTERSTCAYTDNQEPVVSFLLNVVAMLANDFAITYEDFQSPIASLNCGERCAPYNEGGAPFCCDARHAVPSAYLAEWAFLQANTDLWRPWEGRSQKEKDELLRKTPEGQVLIVCQGYRLCQRHFRSITCRSFPFFPYLTREGQFIGLAYYWEYEERCWVISNLQIISAQYKQEFVAAYEKIFAAMPKERETFRQFSVLMRRSFGRKGRAIPLLHRNGGYYKITPHNGRMRRVQAKTLPTHGPYRVAAQLPFSEEM
jgi:hypothetical protein